MLLSLLEITEQEAYDLPGPFDFTTLWTLAGLDLPELRDPPWTPRVPAAFRNESLPLVDVIRGGDRLVHVPYESFDASVERFIREGATDPSTLSVKMTVYRVGDDTPFVQWLIAAAESGKQVACVIELKARFDENRNLHWADELLKVGAHVSFGILELKIHVWFPERRHPLGKGLSQRNLIRKQTRCRRSRSAQASRPENRLRRISHRR